MADSNEFPRLLYRKCEPHRGEPVWGLGRFETRAVTSPDELAAALADGWTQRPDEDPAPAKKAKPAQEPAQ